MKKSDTLDTRIAFSQFVHRALKTKTGRSQSILARQIYGQFMPLLSTIPDQWQLWTDEIDRLPRDKPPNWYLACCKAIAEDAKQARRAEQADGRQGRPAPAQDSPVARLTAGIGRLA